MTLRPIHVSRFAVARAGILLGLLALAGTGRSWAQGAFYFNDAPTLGSEATLVGTGGAFEFAPEDGRYTISMSATGGIATGGSLSLTFNQAGAIDHPIFPMSQLLQPEVTASVGFRFEGSTPGWAPGRYGVAYEASQWGSVSATLGFAVTGSFESAGTFFIYNSGHIASSALIGANPSADFGRMFDDDGKAVETR